MPILAEEFNPARPAGAIDDLHECALPETHLHRR